DRYRLPQPWDEAVKFYRRAYPPGKFPRWTLHSQTAVRAMRIENPERGEWEGVNLYEAGRGEVRGFILTPATPPPTVPAKPRSPGQCGAASVLSASPLAGGSANGRTAAFDTAG